MTYLKNTLILIISFFILFDLSAQNKKENFLLDLMQTKPEHFSDIIKNSKEYRVQIIYTQIDRDEDNFPHFTDYTYRLDENEYYYCASMIKLPVILMTLEKLNKNPKIDKNTKVTFDNCPGCQKSFFSDTTAQNGNITFKHLIKKALVLSNNDAFNRMYDFLGQEYANERIWELGFDKVRILNRFVPCSAQQNRESCQINFFNKNNDLIFIQKPQKSSKITTGWHPNPKIGKGVYNSKTRKTNYQPKNFGHMNYIRLQDLHKLLKMIFFPETFNDDEKFNLTIEDYDMIRKYMGMFPRESKYPWYLPYEKYYDSYVKYYLLGNSTEKVPENIRIFDKVGMSFGFMVDVAYIVDYENNVEFMLSTVIYTNKDGILNNNIYEYRATALPFLEQLGFLILDYEKSRKKENLPKLIKFDYSTGE